MPYFNSPAIIIKSFDYGESDKILTIFTKDFGKIKGIAKGAKRSSKRFGGRLESFSLLNITFFEKDINLLTRIENCDELMIFNGIINNYDRLIIGSYLLELIDEFTQERDKNINEFNLLLFFLNILNEKGLNNALLRVFELRLLQFTGYKPNILICTICGSKDIGLNPGFNSSIGGILCTRCKTSHNNTIKLSLGTLKALRLASKLELSKIDRIKFTSQAQIESKIILNDFIKYRIGKELKTSKLLETILNKESFK